MEKFGVDAIYTPERPVFSHKGAVVTNIAHIPAALTAVMRENAAAPGLRARGQPRAEAMVRREPGPRVPAELDLPAVEAMAPYNGQIALLNRQVGARPPRQTMKDASGASQMDPTSQVTSLHGVIDAADATQYPIEANIALALLQEPGGRQRPRADQRRRRRGARLHGDAALAAAQAARDAGNAPNSVLASAVCIVGPRRVERARAGTRAADRPVRRGGRSRTRSTKRST